MKRLYSLLMAVICATGLMWGDVSVGFEDSDNGVKLWRVPAAGTAGDVTISHGRSQNSTYALGNVNSLYLKEWFAKLYQNADELNQVAGCSYNVYNSDNDRSENWVNLTTNYFNWNEWDNGWRKPTVGNNGLDVNITDGLGSGNYIFEYFFTAQQKPSATIYNSNNSNNFKASFTILPPAVQDITISGYLSGSGTEQDPYVFRYGHALSVVATPAHEDDNSELYVKFGNDVYSTGSEKGIYITDHITIKAKYHNSTANLDGAEYVETIYYTFIYYNVNVVDNSYFFLSADLSSISEGYDVQLNYFPKNGQCEHYHIAKWIVTYGENHKDTVAVTDDGSGNATFTMPASDVTVEAVCDEDDKYTVGFIANSDEYMTPVYYYKDQDIEFPSSEPADICGWSFVGWVEEPIEEATTDEPHFVSEATMGEDNLIFYAVYSHETGESTCYITSQDDILIPSVISFGFEGFSGGSGTQEDPYIVAESDNPYITDVEYDFQDDCSMLLFDFGDGATEDTGLYITSSGSISITAYYHNTQFNRDGQLYQKTIYVAVKHEITWSEENCDVAFTANGEELSLDEVPYGTVVTVTVTPDEHYHISEGSVTATPASDFTEVSEGVYTFTMPDEDVEISATCEEDTKYTVNFTVFDDNTSDYYYEDETITYPDDPTDVICGWSFAGWTDDYIDGTTSSAPDFSTYTQMPAQDLDYYAVFSCKKQGTNYYATNRDELLPPDVVELTFDGYESGEGTENDPYVFDAGDYLTVSASPDHEDPNSQLKLFINDDDNGDIDFYTITQAGELRIEAYYYNAKDDATGSTYEKTIYVALKPEDEPETIEVTISENCYTTDAYGSKTYYATFSSDKAFFAGMMYNEDGSGYEYFSVNEVGLTEDGLLTLEPYIVNPFNPGFVPANRGLLIRSEQPGTYQFVVLTAAEEAEASPVLGEDNLLRPTGAGITAAQMEAADAGCKYYRLAYNDYANRTGLGFYYGPNCNNGQGFDIGPNKAYLAVPNSSAAPARFLLNPEQPIATDVETVNSFVNTTKRLVNGQLVILREGKMFNINGQVVK